MTTPAVTFLAHRGIRDNPSFDNKLESFHEAFRQGFDEVELDVRQCADGLVVFHDSELDDRPVRTLTLREMERRCGAPSLRQTILHFVALDKLMHLDIKCEEDGRTDYAAFALKLDSLLRAGQRLPQWRGRLRVSSFWVPMIEALAERQPPYPLGLLIGEAGPEPGDIEEQLGDRITFVVLAKELLMDHRPLPWLMGEHDVYAYTVNSSQVARKMLAHPHLEVRGIITDRADLSDRLERTLRRLPSR